MDIRNGLISAYNGISASLGTSNAFDIYKSTTGYVKIFNNGRAWFGSGTPVDAGFQMDVNGTSRMFGSVTISTGTTSQGTFIGAGGETRYSSNSGLNTNAVYLSGTSSTSDGIIQFLSGGATSNIVLYTSAGGFIGTRAGAKFGAIDGTDTVSIVTNTWIKIGAGTTARSQINLASSTAPTSPNDGDIWFDGTSLKIRIGGLTKTFTLS